MRHLTVSDFGHYVGTTGTRLQVSHEGRVVKEYPLSRLRTITIAKKGVSFSSNMLLSCAERGIRLFILDWRGVSVASLSGEYQHAVVKVRQSQFQYLASGRAPYLAAEVVYGKVRNQRAVLNYFNKSLKNINLADTAGQLKIFSDRVRSINFESNSDWRNQLLGTEGAAANAYWKALRYSLLESSGFSVRKGRGAEDATNQALNYGYALLTSYVWNALANAGLEVYAGVLHTERPGKPSLVLDIMEEYRPWVVDRTVIKLRDRLSVDSVINSGLKQLISEGIHKTFATRYPCRGRKMRLESILQRQCYRLAGEFVGQKKYRAYRFKW